MKLMKNLRPGLEIGSEDLGMLSQVESEGIRGPPANGLYRLKGYTTEKVLECSANANTMTLKRRKTSGLRCTAEALEEGGFGQR